MKLSHMSIIGLIMNDSMLLSGLIYARRLTSISTVHMRAPMGPDISLVISVTYL
jgi:hypothetical protein